MSENESESEVGGGVRLKPGLLVHVSTAINGGVTRDTKDLPLNTILPEESTGRRYEALIVKEDAEEFARAEQVRGQCRNAIEKLCEWTAFGLLCEKSKEVELVQAIKDSYAKAAEFNATSKHSRVSVWALRAYTVGDEDDVKRFTTEMRDVLQSMDAAIQGLDYKEVRAVVKRATALAAMVEGEHAAKVSKAVEQARAAANEIAKAVRERGENLAGYIVEAQTAAIRIAAASFLDLDAPTGEIQAAPVAASAVDLDAPTGEAPSIVSQESGPVDFEDLPVNEDDVDASAAVDADAAGFRDERDTDSAPVAA